MFLLFAGGSGFTVLSLLPRPSSLISSLVLFRPRAVLAGKIGFSVVVAEASTSVSIWVAFLDRVALALALPLAFCLVPIVDAVDTIESIDRVLVSIDSLRSGMLGTSDVTVSVDCVENLEDFEVRAFLLGGFGATVPAKAKKGQSGDLL